MVAMKLKPTDTELSFDRLVGLADVTRWLGVHRATINRMERRGEFPRRVRITAGRVGWPESAVRRWMAEKIDRANAQIQ